MANRLRADWCRTRWRSQLARGDPGTSSIAGLRPRTGSAGGACGSAMAESFLSTLEAELLSRRRITSRSQVRMACTSALEDWYDPVRLLPGLGQPLPHDHRS